MATRRPLACLVVAAAALVGCTTAPATTPTPTPTPSFSCTPEAGGDAYSCSELEYQQMREEDRLYAEAEEIYRTLFASRMAVLDGESPSVPIERLAAGAALERFEEQWQLGVRRIEGETTLSWVRPLPALQKQGSSVALESCLDSSTVTLASSNGERAQGSVGIERSYFSGSGESMRVVLIETKQVETC